MFTLKKKSILFGSLRNIQRMASNRGLKLKQVIKELETFAPSTFAEKWDNVGLLIDRANDKPVKRILLTVDLTQPVMGEAIEKKADLIISYHPPILKPLTRITQANWMERIAASCLFNSIALYSPHTVWGKVPTGINDWIATALITEGVLPVVPEPNAGPCTGSGRIVETSMRVFKIQSSLENLIKNNVEVALAVGHTPKTIVKRVGICAGSGASILRKVQGDLVITGEMSHQEVLNFTQNGTTVLLCSHNAAERSFISDIAWKLQRVFSDGCRVLISEVDLDPFDKNI